MTLMRSTVAFWPVLTNRRDKFPVVRNALLLVLLFAVLLMPVSYRAGTDHAHAHPVFQIMIDAIRGEPHHHGEQPEASAPSPFSRPGVPLVASAAESPDDQIDLAYTSDTTFPLLVSASLLMLGALVNALLMGSVRREIWSTIQRLSPIWLALESPPPR